MESRLQNKVDFENCTDEQREFLEEIAGGPRGSIGGPFVAWAQSPQLASRAERLGAFCRYHSTLEKKLSELAILSTAQFWRCQTEWIIHAPIAVAAGLDQAVVDSIRNGEPPSFQDANEAIVFGVCEALYQEKRVPIDLYDSAVSTFGERAVVELVGILGYHAFVAMTMNTFAMLPEGTDRTALPFAEPDV
eukprot:gene839-1293_t